MNYSRRGFLKAMAAMSGSALVAPGLLTSRSALAAGEAAAVSDDITTWKISGSHFGAIRAKVVGEVMGLHTWGERRTMRRKVGSILRKPCE